jgi:hypothetical protein
LDLGNDRMEGRRVKGLGFGANPAAFGLLSSLKAIGFMRRDRP